MYDHDLRQQSRSCAIRPIDPLAPVHPYRQIARIIKRQIMSGQYPPNTRIPTESELVETCEVHGQACGKGVA